MTISYTKKSFTLIEVLVSLVILGVLSTFIIVSIDSIIDATNDAKRKKDLDSISKILMGYGILNTYPIKEDCNIGEQGCLDELIPDYTNSFPMDPNGSYYKYSSDGLTYTIKSTLSSEQTLLYNPDTGFTQSQSPTANFLADITSGAAPLEIIFTDASTGNPTSWCWDIDNSGNCDYTTQNINHTYTDSGTYTVKLTIANDYGSDFETKTNYINLENPIYSGGQQKQILITNNSENSLFEYQVKIQISDVSGMSPDLSDLMFSDINNNPLYHWIESISPAIVWVRVPLIVVGGSTIYMYYGGEGDPSYTSNGFNVFEYFENWENGQTNGWTYSANRVLTIVSGYNSNYALRSNYYRSSWGTSNWSAISPSFSLEEGSYKIEYNVWGYTCCNSSTYATSVEIKVGDSIVISRYTPSPYKAWTKKVSNIFTASGTKNISTHSRAYWCTGEWHSLWDNMFIRKAISNEPTTEIIN